MVAMLALLCEISRWFLTVSLVGISLWLAYLIHNTSKLQGHVRVAALAFLVMSNVEKLLVLVFRDQFFLGREEHPDIDMCYIYAQSCHGLLDPLIFCAAIFLARHSYPGAVPSKSGHIGGSIWITVAFVSICIPVDNELFTPPVVPGFCVVSMISGLVAFANTVIVPLTLWNVAKKITANERQVHVRHFAWISILLFVYGILSFVDANLLPGDWAVIMRETMFVLYLYFTINVCYYWIIIPGMLSKAAPVFQGLLLKKKRFVTQSEAPPIRMNSVSQQSKRKPTRKAKRSRRRLEDNNYLGITEDSDDTPDAVDSPTRDTTKTSSQRMSELNFDINAGTRRTPKAVLNKGLTFPRSGSPKKSIETNLRSRTLTRSLISERFPGSPAEKLYISDNEINEEDAVGDIETDEADAEDFMLGREPTLFPSMPCSIRTSMVENNENHPLGDKKLSTMSASADGAKVPLISLSTEKGEDVFGVGFGESPSIKRESNRDTVMWNINDIPIL